MADVYKCTKITNTGESLFSSDAYRFKVDYTDPTTTPPTPGSVVFDLSKNNSTIINEIQDACDTMLLLLGTNEMDWSL
jgi:hypothetical protein